MALKNDAHGVEVVHLFEGDFFLLHFAPNRVATLHSRLHLVVEPLASKDLAQWGSKVLKEEGSLLFAGFYLVFNLVVFGRMLYVEA